MYIDSEDESSEEDCTYISSKLVFSKDVLDLQEDVSLGDQFDQILSELLKVTQDTQRIILDDASSRRGVLRELMVKAETIIVDAGNYLEKSRNDFIIDFDNIMRSLFVPYFTETSIEMLRNI